MSAPRTVGVEIPYQQVSNSFPSTDFRRENKIMLNYPEKQFKVALLMLNLRSCYQQTNLSVEWFRKNMLQEAQIAAAAGGPPAPPDGAGYLVLPTVAQYLAGVWP